MYVQVNPKSAIHEKGIQAHAKSEGADNEQHLLSHKTNQCCAEGQRGRFFVAAVVEIALERQERIVCHVVRCHVREVCGLMMGQRLGMRDDRCTAAGKRGAGQVRRIRGSAAVGRGVGLGWVVCVAIAVRRRQAAAGDACSAGWGELRGWAGTGVAVRVAGVRLAAGGVVAMAAGMHGVA